ncbi:MAG TPA: Kazal-type serine protease inhibitor domain-containing protein [Anaerolineae bacterium]|nr:Kazal-type serine protease inhibitor domain-containing protein [Anaerolineae bacterium]
MISFNVSAESRVQGAKTNANITVTSERAWTVLSSATVRIPEGEGWQCVATGSADGKNPANGTIDNQYRFTLSIDNVNPAVDGPCERTLQFNDNGGVRDTIYDDVNSTCSFNNIRSGNRVIRWLARKTEKNPDAPNLIVLDNSLTVVCSDSAQTCSNNTQCSAQEYCKKPTGQCAAQSSCVVKPTLCPLILAPVCGCDGQTYNNACAAAAAGVSVDHTGECEGQ